MSLPESMQLSETIGKRVDPAYSKKLQARLRELLNWQREGFPGSRPVDFESKHLRDIEREDYFVTEKAEGVRYLLYFLHSPKGPASFLFDRNQMWYYVPNLLFPSRGRDEFLKDTLMDGELVLDIDADRKTWRYLIFDLMIVNGSPIVQRSFNSRLGMLQQDVIHPFNGSLKSITDANKSPPFTIELKKMERAYGLRVLLDQIPKLKHRSNGIIFIPVKCPYTPGKCNKLLKWKPPESIFVNFRLSAKWSKEHKPIYSIELLSNGGTTYNFYDHFQPDAETAAAWRNNLPDGRTGEFKYDPACEVTIIEQGYAPTVRTGGWRFVRFKDENTRVIDESAIKQVLKAVHHGIPTEKMLANMDRVRAAWKAREKGLPMPPLHTNEIGTSQPQSLQQQTPPPSNQSKPLLDTHRSSMSDKDTPLQKSATNVSAPLSTLDDRRIATDDNVQDDCQQIATSTPTAIVLKRKMSQDEAEVPESANEIENEPVSYLNSRKKSRTSVDEGKQNEMVENEIRDKHTFDTSPKKTQQISSAEGSPSPTIHASSSATMKHSTSASAPLIGTFLDSSTQNIDTNVRTADLSAPARISSDTISSAGNRRSKSISKSINPTTNDTTPPKTTPTNLPPKTKKHKHSNILDLLAPTAVSNTPEPKSSQRQPSSQQPHMQPKQTVQFINYHAEERHSATDNNSKNVLIIRSEARPEPHVQQHLPAQPNIHQPNLASTEGSFQKFNYNEGSKKTKQHGIKTKGTAHSTERSTRLANLPNISSNVHPQNRNFRSKEYSPYQNQRHSSFCASPTALLSDSQAQAIPSEYPPSSLVSRPQQPSSPASSSAATFTYRPQQQHLSPMSGLQPSDRSAPALPTSTSYDNAYHDPYHRRQQRQHSEHLPANPYYQDPSLVVHPYQHRLSLPPSLPRSTPPSPHQYQTEEQHPQYPQRKSGPAVTPSTKRKDSQKAKLDFILN